VSIEVFPCLSYGRRLPALLSFSHGQDRIGSAGICRAMGSPSGSCLMIGSTRASPHVATGHDQAAPLAACSTADGPLIRPFDPWEPIPTPNIAITGAFWP
jgi:hypothetical protein